MSTRLDLDGARTAMLALPEHVDRRLLARLRELPVMLRRTGLIATYATVLARRTRPDTGAAYKAVATALATSIATELRIPGPVDEKGVDAVLVALSEATPSSYAAASRRVDEVAVWIKRLAEARHAAQPPADPDQGSDEASHGAVLP